MVASGGTDIDWLIEHKGSFIILEFKYSIMIKSTYHKDKLLLMKNCMKN